MIGHLRKLSNIWDGQDWQTLSAIKGGRSGIRNINESAHAEAVERVGAWPDQYVAGERVIHLVNDYDRGLMNGALGHVVATTDEGGLVLEFDGEQHAFSASDLIDRIELAYAISVHKGQGSQFRRVAVVIGKSRLLDHALIYTALTRGVEQVVFLGDHSAYERAVLAQPLVEKRCVAFSV